MVVLPFLTGTTHSSLSFDTGSVWSPVSAERLWCPVIKYGATTQLTCGNIQPERGHVRIEHPMLDLCEDCRCIRTTRTCLHNKFKFFNQFEVFSKTSDPFFKQGDSGSLVFMLENMTDPTLHCIGLAIAFTSYNSCYVTPIHKVLESFNLKKGFVKSVITPMQAHASSEDSMPGSSKEKTFEERMLETLHSISFSLSSKIDERSAETTSAITDVKRSVGQLEKDMKDMKQSFVKLETDKKEDEPVAKKRKIWYCHHWNNTSLNKLAVREK